MRHQNFPLQNVLLQYTYCVLTLLIENPLKDFKIPVTYAIVTNKLLCTLVCKHKKFKDTSKEWKGVRNRDTAEGNWEVGKRKSRKLYRNECRQTAAAPCNTLSHTNKETNSCFTISQQCFTNCIALCWYYLPS